MLRRVLVGIVMPVTALLLVASAASAVPVEGNIGPNQQFGGLVNGKNSVSAPVAIRMACFGAVRPGETGHPMSGQSVEVFRPEAIRGQFGDTGGRADRIVAFFGPPPPSPAAPPSTASTVTFTKYGVKKMIPTSLKLPCAGRGVVTFVPMATSKTARDATVRVSYVGQP
jgi:hypothetical protein